MGDHPGSGPRRGVTVEEPQRRGGPHCRQVDARTLKPGPHPASVKQFCREDAQGRRLGVRSAVLAVAAGVAKQSGIGSTARIEGDQFATLATFGINDLQLVSGVERQHGGAATGHPVALNPRPERQQSRHEDTLLL